MGRRWSLPLIGLIVLLFAAPIAAAGTVAGQFKLGSGVVIAPKAAVAYPVREQYDARTESIEVMLSTAPIDAVAVANALNPHAEAINQDVLEHDNYILLWVEPDGRVSMNATFRATMTQYIDRTGDDGGLKAALTAHTPDHVAGRIFTPTPVKVMSGESYTCDITFDADVTRPKAGAPLPAGGGEPGKAFSAMMASAQNKNWDALRNSVSERLRNMFDADYRTPEENLEYAVDFLQTALPKQGRKITGGTLRGDAATLEIEGEMFPGQTAVYFAKMVKIRGAWLFDGASLTGLVK
ncbi:MAG: hypothetical protein M0Z60_03600 [Nitrospiraceae bacterium]|nr:hypothetical protein [Nitrospiraceae bacterium]